MSIFSLEKEYNEAEVRFGTTDHIIKALCEISGCKVKLEDVVRESDEDYLNPNRTLPDSVSCKSTSDYVLYVIELRNNVKLVLVEVKADKKLSKNIIAQTIGYYIASQVAAEYIPMALVLTQSKARLIFFPFMIRNSVSLNAIITEELMIISNITTYASVIGFTAKYIMGNPKGVSTKSSRLIAKRSFEKVLIPAADYKKHKEQILRQELQRKNEQLQRKDEQLQQKDEQHCQELQQKDEQLQQNCQELQQKDEQLQQKDEQLQQMQQRLRELELLLPLPKRKKP